jgi:hypothetical protein
MLEYEITDLIATRDHDPLTILADCRKKQKNDPRKPGNHREQQLRGIDDLIEVLALCKRALQSPTLETIALFNSRFNWSFDNERDYMVWALDFLDGPDAEPRSINGCTISDWFTVYRDVVDTAYRHQRYGHGVTTIARQKGRARSTVYSQLQSFQHLPADTQQMLLQCMQHLLDIDAREDEASRERNAG